jgi:heme exporter protein A
VSAPALAARGLSRRFGRVVALDAVALEVPSGSLLAVLGANGAGKSTLLRLLAGLARPTAGTVEIDGVRAERRAARARVGYVGHATFLYPALSARENLVFAARLFGVRGPHDRAAALLEEAGLADVADREAGGFSRGMAQRLSIARALVHEPTVLLLDEPTSGLDGPASDRLARRLAELRTAGRACVLVTHDTALAARLADDALVLARGRVASRFPPGAVDAAVLGDALREAASAG